MRPLVEVLQRQLDEIKAAIDANQSQRDSLQRDLAALQKQRDDLKAAVDFLKARP